MPGVLAWLTDRQARTPDVHSGFFNTPRGSGPRTPLAERQTKPDQRFAYSVNFMPDSPQKRVLVMKYNLFLHVASPALG
jgi:hypothetical protein